jgi:MFS family permease
VLVDRVGRKPLLYVGACGMTASLLLLAYSFHSPNAFKAAPGVVATICLIVYIACFAFSMGPIAWILASEVFPLRVRGRGIAAASLGSGASNFVVSLTFLSLIKAAGNSVTFLIYAAFCIITLLFIRFIVPETKGRELETISSEANAISPRTVPERESLDHAG